MKFFRHLLCALISLTILGCSSGGSGGGANGYHHSVAVIADTTYHVKVCFDRNGSKKCDIDEPYTTDEINGVYILNGVESDSQVPLLAELSTTPVMATTLAVGDAYILESPAGQNVISSLTTIIKGKMDANPALTLAAAQTELKQAMGIAEAVDVFDSNSAANAATEATKLFNVLALMFDTLRNLGIEFSSELMGFIYTEVNEQLGNVMPQAPEDIVDSSVGNKTKDDIQQEIDVADSAAFIEIYSVEDLNKIRDNLSANYKLMTDLSLSAFNAGQGWEPIGSPQAPFKGKFEGNGFKITNLYINNTAMVGLFGSIDNATIRNLGVVVSSISGPIYVGGIVGYMHGGMIRDCYTTGGTITAHATVSYVPIGYVSYYPAAGGIVGSMDYGTIRDSYSENNIVSEVKPEPAYPTGIPVNNAHAYSGGIVGRTSSSTIINNYATGTISAVAYDATTGMAGGATAGGIVGYAYNGTIIKNNYNGGIVSTDSSQSSNNGGIIGEVVRGTVTNNYSTGRIIDNTAFTICGGIAGLVSDSDNIITNNYSTKTIECTATDTLSFFGGIAGSVNTATITLSNNAAINPSIGGTEERRGRIAGFNGGNVNLSMPNNFALDTMTIASLPPYVSAMWNGVDKTDAELKTKETYSAAINGNGLGGLGWKFGNDDDNPWKMPTNGGYPVLYWQ